jgi:SAM-dependent methyltransferase
MALSTNERKYQTQNPAVRWLIARFLARVEAEVRRLAPARIVDLGCGEGEVVGYLRAHGLAFEYLGIDQSEDAIARARARHAGAELCFRQGDLVAPPGASDAGDVALCLEVLEHVTDPGRALDSIAAWTRNAALISVPWEPYFRLGNLARGKYLAHLGNHPEHVQAFTPGTLAAMLRRRFAAVRTSTCFPWILATVGERLPGSISL